MPTVDHVLLRMAPVNEDMGLSHIAFEVPDPAAKRDEILAWGGRDYGEAVTIDIPGAGRLSLQYLCDPEGNIVELQRWHTPPE